MNQIDTTVGANVSRLREASRQSLSQLAAVLHVTETQLDKLERGVERVSASMLLTLCAVFSVKVDQFFLEWPTEDQNVGRSPPAKVDRSRQEV